MLRVDLEAKVFVASVLDLIAPPDDVPRPASVLALARAQIGTEIHAAWRAERERDVPGFRAEVVVDLECEVEGFSLTLRGRADGTHEREDGSLVVEEVKSVGVTSDRLRRMGPAELADAHLQVQLYALCLAAARPGFQVRPRLVLVSLVDGARREIEVPFDAAHVHQRLETRVRHHLAAARAARRRAKTRASLAEEIRFPYAEPRPYQDELSSRVTEGLEAGRPVLATAPTGVGKTVAALVPALRYALARDATLFFLTAKNTQQALVARTFEDVAGTLASSGRPPGSLRALTLRQKRGMCPPGTLLCHPDHCAHVKGFLDRPKRELVLEDLLHLAVHLEPDAIYTAGDEATVCPYALSLALTLQVDLVIGDVNYVYDPTVSLSHFGNDKGRPLVAIVDEAHNLFDRAREYWSPFLALDRVAEVHDQAKRGDLRAPGDAGGQQRLPLLGTPPDADVLFREVVLHLDRTRDETLRTAARAEEGCPSAIDGCRPVRPDLEPWADITEAAAHLLLRYAHYQQAHGLIRPEDLLIDVLHTTMAVGALIRMEAEELVPYAATGADAKPGAGIGVLCVDPARLLAERHAAVAGTVAMSATLDPLDYYADVLGLRDLDPFEVALPTPFPAENRCVLVVPTVATTWRERKRHYDRIAELVESVTRVREGNYVAYFPSFAFLREIAQRLRVPKDVLLVQEPRMSPKARARVLARLGAADRPTLLLAVMGGVFAEGIDLPGEALIGAIVVGPGLPQVGFERALMQHHFDEGGRSGFAYAMLFPGMQRVVQSAGRVHRTPDDRGVIVLLGSRFVRSPYVDCLPDGWSRYGVEELVVEDPVPALEAFWGYPRR